MVHILDHLYYGITLITMYLSLYEKYIYCMPLLYTTDINKNQIK